MSTPERTGLVVLIAGIRQDSHTENKPHHVKRDTAEQNCESLKLLYLCLSVFNKTLRNSVFLETDKQTVITNSYLPCELW